MNTQHRFVLFAGPGNYRRGGMRDVVTSFRNLEAAKVTIAERCGGAWYHVYDHELRMIVLDSEESEECEGS